MDQIDQHIDYIDLFLNVSTIFDQFWHIYDISFSQHFHWKLINFDQKRTK